MRMIIAGNGSFLLPAIFFRSKAAVFAVSILVLILAIITSLCVGVVMYTPAQLLELPAILRYIRFPRVMAAVFAGAGLAGAGTSKMTILLSGVVLNSLLNAASEALSTFFPDIHMSYAVFRVGGLSTVQTSVLYPAAILITVLFIIVQLRANTLELLSLSENTVCCFLYALQAWQVPLSALQD